MPEIIGDLDWDFIILSGIRGIMDGVMEVFTADLVTRDVMDLVTIADMVMDMAVVMVMVMVTAVIMVMEEEVIIPQEVLMPLMVDSGLVRLQSVKTQEHKTLVIMHFTIILTLIKVLYQKEAIACLQTTGASVK